MDFRKTILAVFILALIGGGVFMTVEMSTSGGEIEKLQKEESSLKEENRQLKAMLVEDSSLSSLEKNAPSLGFFKPENTLYITDKEVFVAKLP